MELRIISSGSEKGNSLLINGSEGRFLCDCGLSLRSLQTQLSELWNKELDGCFLTHEHGDHAKGAVALSHNYRVPLYGSPGTLAALSTDDKKPILEPWGLSRNWPDAVTPIPVSHDAAEPFAYRVRDEAGDVGVIYDCGMLSELLYLRLKGVRCLVIEMNHEPWLLHRSGRPELVIRRTEGPLGHLSNFQAWVLICELKPEFVVATHLSRMSNSPQIAAWYLNRTGAQWQIAWERETTTVNYVS